MDKTILQDSLTMLGIIVSVLGLMQIGIILYLGGITAQLMFRVSTLITVTSMIAFSMGRIGLHPMVLGLGVILGSASMALFLVFTFRRIVKPIKALLILAEALSVGDLSGKITCIDSHNKDEIGRLASTFRKTKQYQEEMVDIALKVANCDLTKNVYPKGDKDILGNAFAQMVVNLRYLAQQVINSAVEVDNTSTQLSNNASRSEHVTNQIANVIQQVADRAILQTSNVSSTTASIENMLRTIGNVAQSASEQEVVVKKSRNIANQISNTIQQVATNAQTETQRAAQAADTARHETKIVKETISGMERIKTKVGFSVRRVQEMGDHSHKIGSIVQTIDDIAAQTNLLALNAAIEAARAGDHGKGFAVVADEVRKLAEKSAYATKEIADLIQAVQLTVGEAVNAMAESAQEVEVGVARAYNAGKALAEIMDAVETVNQQVDGIATAAQDINNSSQGLVETMDQVAIVVEKNTLITRETAINSNEVTDVMQNIASFSRENSTCAKEVSATTIEMSVQAEEVTASARALSSMAKTLQNLVTQFQLPEIPSDQDSSPVETDASDTIKAFIETTHPELASG